MVVDTNVSWSYHGSNCCAHWGDHGFPIAKSGLRQSPIALCTKSQSHVQKVNQPPIRLTAMPEMKFKLKNNGFTVKAYPESKERAKILEIASESYTLLEFHFHSPTEHTIDGNHFPLELHLVLESLQHPGKLSVIAILFEIGDEASNTLDTVFDDIPSAKGLESVEPVTINLNDFLLNCKDVFSYNGSLTTPPCTEGISWYVLERRLCTTSNQLKKYFKRFPLHTNRPVQQLNNRTVTLYRAN